MSSKNSVIKRECIIMSVGRRNRYAARLSLVYSFVSPPTVYNHCVPVLCNKQYDYTIVDF